MIKLQQFVKIMGLLVAIDSVYIYFMRNYFNTQIRIIQGSFILFNQKLLIGAVITYVLLAFALHYFVLSNRQKSKSYSFERNAFLLGIIIYTPVLFGIIPTKVTMVSHSIHYEVYPWGPLIWIYTIGYAITLIMSLLFSSGRRINIFGIMLLISGFVAYWWYIYAFTSIWCFFAAILSTYITYIIYKLPMDSHLSRRVLTSHSFLD